MYFDGDIIELGEVNLRDIAQWVLEQPEEDWNEISFRQSNFKTHNNTESLFLLYDHRTIVKKNKRFLQRFNPILKEIQRIVEAKVNNKVVLNRVIIPRLKPHGFIRRHVDSGGFLTTNWRCHFPLITNPNVKFFVGNTELNMKENHGYIINNQRIHGVSNNSPYNRYHLIVDFGEKNV